MKNKKIRLALMDRGITQYELARIMGVSESTIGRKLRVELPAEETEEILRLIEERGEAHE